MPLTKESSVTPDRGTNRRFVMGGFLILFILALGARLPFLSPHLYDWDLVQLALGVRQFNLALRQPHPPGYILFVGFGRLLNTFLGNVNLSFTLLSAVSSALSTSLIFILSFRLFAERRTAVFASLLWLTSPLVWFYGEVGETYAVGACAGLAFAYAIWRFWKQPTGTAAIVSAGLYAFAAGIRQDLTAFLFLLWLAPYLWSRPCRRFWLQSVLTSVAAYLSWYVPTVMLSGGYAAYSKIMSGQFLSVARSANIFLGASPIQHAWILFRQGSALFDGLLGFWVLIPTLLLLKRGAAPKDLMGTDEWRFLIAWASPSLLFFTFLYFAKLGYFLVCLPALVLLASRWVAASTAVKSNPRLFEAALLVAVLVNVVFFFGAREIPEYRFVGQGSAGVRLLVRALNNSVLTPTEHKVATTEIIRRAYFDTITRTLSAKPAVMLLLASWGRDELSWRTLMYYYPYVPVYGIMSDFMSAAGPPTPLLVGFGQTSGSSGRREALSPGEPVIVSMLGRSQLLLVCDIQLPPPQLLSPVAPGPGIREIVSPLPDPRVKTFRLYVVDPGPGPSVPLRVGGYIINLVR
jgi:hypothetical protein